jgi:hypothetical protein
MRKFGIVGVVLGTLAFATWTTTSVIAQMFAAWTELEIEQTKKELERIIADNPAQADNAKKTRDTLPSVLCFWGKIRPARGSSARARWLVATSSSPLPTV